ncbi:class I SAM-dependent methyltransferase [Thermococcus barophilus]|uniref:class I SAM-dependent methyltransferase n=1 Tax=Thermococcus barophilus TaxID=55802 RepID=UPI00192BBEDD|nr:methyltransferase domain-containing protein [Thermococcus barophilus]
MSRVYRTKAQAKKTYDRISRFYDYFAGVFEGKYRDRALELLDIKKGEIVLEIGFGTGHCLKKMAELVGKEGKVYGIDISSGMLEVSRKRLEKAGLLDRVELYCGDASKLPYEDNKFDAVFMSFTLELFDTPEIPEVLNEVRRVLKPGGRLGVVSMSKEGRGLLMRIYEWLHEKLPQYLDCRPIHLSQTLKDAGFLVMHEEVRRIFGLPIEIIIALKPGRKNHGRVAVRKGLRLLL